MKKNLLIILFSFLFMQHNTAATATHDLTLSDVVNGQFRAQQLGSVTPMPESNYYTQANSNHTQIIKYDFKTGEKVEVIFDVNEARKCPFKHFDSYQFSPDGKKLLIATDTRRIYRRSYTANHYIYPLKRNVKGVTTNNIIEQLSENGPQQSPVFSPDGHMIAFVRNNNIFLVKMLYKNSESQVTTDGERNKIINGVPDWVYEEEFAFNSALQFSPDSRMLAFIKFDESKVKSYSFQLFKGTCPEYKSYADYPGEYVYKYPKAGEDNSIVKVCSYDIKSHVTRTMKLPIQQEDYVPRIRFTKDPERLAIMTLNRHQNRFDLYYANPRSTTCKLILRDESEYYIKEHVFDNIVFYDKHFSLLSERDGYCHLYWYTINGNLTKQVTKGEFEVKRFIGYNKKEGTFYYTSNQGSPLQEKVFKTDYKGRTTCLTKESGINTPVFSSTMNYFINRYTDLNTPYVITLNDNRGKVLKTLIDNKALVEKIEEYNLPQKEFFTFKNAQGVKLNGWIMKPNNLDESKKYPLLLTQYSGPGSQQVLDSYGVSWETYMATQGYVVACVDGRGTGGRGEAFEKCTYMNIGIKEAEDQVAAAQYLGTLPFVDKENIGIWGWSYGGYTTLMSMSQGTPVFKAGVAVAPPTDWKYYDTIYTERFMRTPKENADGYKTSSAFNRAEQLHGSLLIVQGMADDNVHFQNTAEYSEHLVQLGKQFDMQIYTNRNHSIYGGNTRMHLFTRLTNFFNRELK